MRGLSKQIMDRIEALGRISEEPGRLTRTFGSRAMRQANELAARWMREAGMTVRRDAVGNLFGHYTASKPSGAGGVPPMLLIGSHLDTVRNAGKFDGILGVLLGIACVERLRREHLPLPFDLEVAAFADEEGVRFQSAYLGSRAAAGRLDEAALGRADDRGISAAEAIGARQGDIAAALSLVRPARIDPGRLLGYFEAHIEQGPVLEERNLAVGLVSAIAGQSRCVIRFSGKAGHAGTCPMSLRRDAVCGAAEFILAVEKLGRGTPGLVATVGRILAEPNAANVIPGTAALTLDVRHQSDRVRRGAVKDLLSAARRIAAARGLQATAQTVQQEPAAPCSRELSAILERAVRRHQPEVAALPSGAGHDAVMMAGITPVSMLFVRCKGGVSHHPAESVRQADIVVALKVILDFIHLLALDRSRHGHGNGAAGASAPAGPPWARRTGSRGFRDRSGLTKQI